MHGLINKLPRVRNSTLVGIFLLLLSVALVLYFGLRDTETDIFRGTQNTFQSQRLDFSFVSGEVKQAATDIENLVFASVHLEGRVLSEPVEIAELFELIVSFPTVSGGDVQAIVVFPIEGDVGLVIANEGAIGLEVTQNIVPVSEAMPLLKTGDPVQVRFYLDEISDSLRGNVMSHPLCQEKADLCIASLDELDGWYGNNLQLIEAVRDEITLPDSHRVGAVQELVVYDDK